jgi:hypothetical protein
MQRQIDIRSDSGIGLDRQITELTKDLSPYFGNNLRDLSNQNIKVIIDYIDAIRTETDVSKNYRRDIIDLLTKFSKFHKMKNFKGFDPR